MNLCHSRLDTMLQLLVRVWRGSVKQSNRGSLKPSHMLGHVLRDRVLRLPLVGSPYYLSYTASICLLRTLETPSAREERLLLDTIARVACRHHHSQKLTPPQPVAQQNDSQRQ